MGCSFAAEMANKKHPNYAQISEPRPLFSRGSLNIRLLKPTRTPHSPDLCIAPI
jgi:hypothetical protein